MKKALDNRESKLAKNATPNEAEAGTLLAHLVNHTQGKIILEGSIQSSY